MIFLGNQRFLYPQYQSGPAPGPSAASAVVEDDDGLGPLPAGWERRVQPEGRVYFVNHKVNQDINIRLWIFFRE